MPTKYDLEKKLNPQKKKRKATNITFLFPTDYTDPKKSSRPFIENADMMGLMTKILKDLDIDKYDIIATDSENYSDKLKEKNIPDLWLYDPSNSDVCPMEDSFIVDFDDGLRKMFLIIPQDFLTNDEDIMFQ